MTSLNERYCMLSSRADRGHTAISHADPRKNTPKWAELQPGDVLMVRRSPSSDDAAATSDFAVRVLGKRHYATVRAYLEMEGLLATLPGVASVEMGLQVYASYWTEAEVAEHGVLALELAGTIDVCGSSTSSQR